MLNLEIIIVIRKFYHITIFLTSLSLLGCIEEYIPEFKESSEKIVIDGSINNLEGKQYVRISKSTSVASPSFNGISGCFVEIIDNLGNSFVFIESTPGYYIRSFTSDETSVGNSYTLHVITSDGNEYMSDYVVMQDCPEIDSVYYHQEKVYSLGEEFNYDGVQFYVDINTTENFSRYYAYQLEETWEVVTPYVAEYVYDSSKVMVVPDHLIGLNHCWQSNFVEDFFVASTASNSENKLQGARLHYVSNYSSRLTIKYSIRVRQMSISEDAYNYFSELRAQSFETGDFYEKQPSQLIGNICNINDSDEEVLGYFTASAVKTKRIFVSDSFPFGFHDYDYCTISQANLRQFQDMASLWPIYLVKFGNGYGWTSKSCFDCTLSGGVTERPVFWDEN